MIEIRNIVKKFGKLHALNGVSISMQPGLAIALIGPNGSGKTTLIKCLLQINIPDSGEIIFNGQKIQADYTYRNQIGYMPQIGRYPDNMTIGQLFEMMKDIRKGHFDKLDEELVDAFGMSALLNKKLGTLSGGTRQKVSACLAFLFNPPVLILDEPTAGLDPMAVEILKDKIIKEKRNGKLILITSHVLSELDDIASHVMYMFEGNIKFFKSITELNIETGETKLGKAIVKMLGNEAMTIDNGQLIIDN